MQLKILSWNIWCDGNFAQIAEFLRSSNADIIGLQEVVPEDTERDVTGFLTGLGYNHVFSAAMEIRSDGIKMGNAIFSKYPIIATKTHILSDEKRRVAVEADITIGASTLKVFSLHTLHTHQKESDILNLQVENLISVLPKDRLVVMGDFNATPDTVPIKRMREVLVDTDPTEAPTWSLYPEGCHICRPQKLNIRLDYIFVSKDLKTHSPQVGSSKGSDHLPISVIVEV
ncbi:MAG: endonuclease/exonuclease/phosphatase family protein [bacterium]|nr:endonuclease/exonuclease/phosphatase family protein [bacterium]